MTKIQTNPADWSALTPVLLGDGPRAAALHAAIRTLIETGLAAPGAKLPTTRDLATRLGVSRVAAVTAYETLVAEGFTIARVGAGTFVAEAVPALPRSAAGDARRAAPQGPLPCELGVALADARTMRLFRGFLARRLSRPGPEHFSYGDARGNPALREAIAAYLRGARGVRCGADQVMVTSGAMHGLDLLVRATLRPGDAVWIEDPCYPHARAVIERAGGRVVGVPVDAEGLDPVRGEQICPEARLVYVTPSHQFPLGVTLSMRRRLALIDWARRSGAWIVEDDYDSEFRYAGPPLTALQGVDGSERVAYLGTFAKVLFPGLRVGYAVAPPPLACAMQGLRALGDRQPSSLAEGALADFLAEGQLAAHLRRTRRKVRSARDALADALREHGEGRLEVAVPEQGLHLIATLTAGSNDVAIADALREIGVAARALSPMYLTAPPKSGLVLGFSGFDETVLREAARRICAAVQA